MGREPEWWKGCKNVFQERIPPIDKGSHEGPVASFIADARPIRESSCRFIYRAMEKNGRPVIHRVRERDPWMHPFESVGLERQATEKGGRQSQGVDGGPHIVHESW